MEQEPAYIPYTPPTPPKKERRGLKVLGMTVLLLLLAGSATYGVLAWMQTNDLQTKLTDEQNKTKTLTGENSRLKSELSAKPQTTAITETLPDGSKLMYPDTEGNRNVLWWNAGQNEGSIVLSHKGLQQYLAAVDTGVLTKICGTDEKPKAVKYNIPLGTLATATKEFTLDTTDNCVTLLASEKNTDEVSRAAAKKVLETAKADVAAFTEAATIEQSAD